jgi:zinc transporter ZupT
VRHERGVGSVILLVGVLPFFSTLLGGFAVFRLHHRLHAVMAFAAGVIVATALVDLLPEAIELIGDERAAMTAGVAAVVGYLVYAAVEVFIHHGSFEHGHPPGEATAEPHEHLPATSMARNGLGWIGPAGLIVHSTLDGLAIGLGFEASAELGLLVLAAVLVHDFADGLNVVTLAFAGGRSRRAALVLLGLDAAAPILGIALSQIVAVAPQTLGLLLGVFAGAFIAIGASHLLPEAEHRQHESVSPLVALTIAGAVLVVIVRTAVG